MVLLLERAALDTSTSFSRWDGNCPSTSKTPVVRKELAIAAHAGITSIKDR
jgi:hypothetical protein